MEPKLSDLLYVTLYLIYSSLVIALLIIKGGDIVGCVVSRFSVTSGTRDVWVPWYDGNIVHYHRYESPIRDAVLHALVTLVLGMIG